MPIRSKTSLPSTRKQWEQEAKSHKVLDTSIHELLNVASASSIGPEQYYSLRVLWKVKTFRLPDATVLGPLRMTPPIGKPMISWKQKVLPGKLIWPVCYLILIFPQRTKFKTLGPFQVSAITNCMSSQSRTLCRWRGL